MSDSGGTFNTRAARAMRAAYEGQKTGALICETEEAKRLVFFESGQLVGAKSDLVRDRLGEVLVREKRITAEQLGRPQASFARVTGSVKFSSSSII